MSSKMYRKNVLRKELFIDNDFIEEMREIKKTFHNPEKCVNNPVIPVDKSWEYGAAFVDTGLVFYDEKEEIFKAWYQGGRCLGKGDHSTMCYATSADGVHWKKPILNLIEFEGSKQNNILLFEDIMMHDPAVILDLKDPNPERHYKAIWWGGKAGNNKSRDDAILGHCVAFSHDGIHWKPYPDNPVWCSDAEIVNLLNVEHRDGKYVAYCSVDGYGMRVVGRTESEDFIHWDLPPKLIFKSDENDPPATEMSSLSAVEYYGNYIGLLYVIRRYPIPTREYWSEIVEEGRKLKTFAPAIAMNTGRAGRWTIHSELVFSRDGIDWQRINREPFITLGDEGSWDECLSLSGRLFVFNDKMMFYYTGQGREENLPGEKPKPIKDCPTATGLATMRVDGFVSLHAEDQEGILVTKIFEFKGRGMVINATVRDKGYIKMEVLDANGQLIPGYTQKECKPLINDNLYHIMSWNGKTDIRNLDKKYIKLRIFLKKSDLFSVSFI